MHITLNRDGVEHRVLAHLLCLPSGRQIYVGQYEGMKMISDGKIHFLEYTWPNNDCYFLPSLLLLWAHFSLSFNHQNVPSREAGKQASRCNLQSAALVKTWEISAPVPAGDNIFQTGRSSFSVPQRHCSMHSSSPVRQHLKKKIA